MAKLTPKQRAELPDSAFAYIDSKGKRSLPIHDETRVRNALARFDRVRFESDTARERARRRLLNAAKKHGIVPVGFITTQLETERILGQIEARTADLATLPSGELTLMFTDIEGSTRLLRQLGPEYATVLETTRDITRRAVARAKGHEVEMRADETFSVFTRALGAVQAAISIQRSLAKRSWPADSGVKVRMGLHTGATELTDTGYIGLAVNAAARIVNAAHGGQILISDAVRAACRTMPAGVELIDLGAHRLAGIPDTPTIHQVVAKGLGTNFPPLRLTTPRD